MSLAAVVITGARSDCAPLIKSYAYGLLKLGDEFTYIQHSGIEMALAKAHLMDPGARYDVTDVIETQARLAYCRGARLCILVGQAACNSDSESFRECIQDVRLERDAIMKWNFQQFLLACITPRREIISVA